MPLHVSISLLLPLIVCQRGRVVSTATTTSSDAGSSDTNQRIAFSFGSWSPSPKFGWGIDTELLPGSDPRNTDIPTPWYHPTFSDAHSLSPQKLAFQDHNYYLATVQVMPFARDHSKLVIATQYEGNQRDFLIGPNSFLVDFRGNFTTDPRIPTVPFGFDLGLEERFNGSVVLGGAYDANRIASTSWHLLDETAAGNATFLARGTQQLQVALIAMDALSSRSTFQTSQISAIMDFNNYTIVLPHDASFQCSSDIVIAPPGVDQPDAAGAVLLAANKTRDACVQREADDTDQTLVLGRPFFQAAYIYVEEDGAVYVASTNQHDLPVRTVPFDRNSSIEPAASPTLTQTSSGALPTSGASAGALLYSTSFVLLWIVVHLTLVSIQPLV